jgi:hypothetical protein
MNWKTCGVTNVYSVTLCKKERKKLSNSRPKRKKSYRKVVKKLSKNCQIFLKKLSKTLSKKNCQKVVKKFKKLTKGNAMYHWSFHVSRETMLKEKKKYFWRHRRVKVSKCVTSIFILNW